MKLISIWASSMSMILVGCATTRVTLAPLQSNLPSVVAKLERACIHATYPTRKTPLCTAIAGNDREETEKLLSFGASIYETDGYEYNSLHYAAQGSLWFVRRIVERDCTTAFINAKNIHRQTPLHLSIRSSDNQVTLFLLDNGANVSERDHDERMPIHYAAALGNVKAAEPLLQKVECINALDVNGHTPLHLAVFYKQLDFVAFLLERGADFTIDDSEGRTALHLAAYTGLVDIIAALLKKCIMRESSWFSSQALHSLIVSSLHDAPRSFKHSHDKNLYVNCQDKAQCSPLFIAAQFDQVDAVKALLQNGANVNLCAIDGTSPLVIAAAKNHCEVIKTLIANGANTSASSKNGNFSPLRYAFSNDSVESIKELLHGGADINHQDYYGNTLLLDAVQMNSLSEVKELVRLGANILPGRYDVSPLHCAAFFNRHEMIELFLQHKVNVNFHDAVSGETPLHFAARICDISIADVPVDVVSVLVKFGANVNALDRARQTPLHVAVDCGYFRGVQVLMEGGADVCAVDKDGNTPIRMAVKKFSTKRHIEVKDTYFGIIHALLKDTKGTFLAQKAFGWNVLCLSAYTGNLLAFTDVAVRHAYAEAQDLTGFTPLHYAAYYGHLEIVLRLADKASRLEIADYRGHLPIHYAVKMRQYAVVEALLQRGANVNAAYSVGVAGIGPTLLHQAVASNDLAMVKLLLTHGANVGGQNLNEFLGGTLLHVAAFNGCNEIILVLIDKGIGVNELNKRGETPLHFAALNGHDATIKLLMDESAYVNSATTDGKTPLYYAAENGHFTAVKVLCQSKTINLDAIYKHKMSPSFAALSRGHREIFFFLDNLGEKLRSEYLPCDQPEFIAEIETEGLETILNSSENDCSK